MELRGIKFKKVWCASGVQGFFGEGYWFHQPLKPFGLDFAGATFVAKTTTLLENKGNMELNPDFTPRELLPDCIWAPPWKDYALNAIALSGPGARALFERYEWQKRTKPFFISFMSIEDTPEKRLEELRCFLNVLNIYVHELEDFRAPVGLQINYSCPSVGLHLDALLREVSDALDTASRARIPLMPKFNLLIPVEAARDISRHPACDGICMSNTIPFNQLPKDMRRKLFGFAPSPLAKYGGGGLSGGPLLPFLLAWLTKARRVGLEKPINGGGGILSLGDAKAVLYAGADSIFLGSIAFKRPWRVRHIIHTLQNGDSGGA